MVSSWQGKMCWTETTGSLNRMVAVERQMLGNEVGVSETGGADANAR